MVHLFNKKSLLGLLTSLCLMSTSLTAWEDGEFYSPDQFGSTPYGCAPCDCAPVVPACCNSGKIYIGGFGGGIYSNRTHMSQLGTAFFSETSSIGPLAIVANGRTGTTSSGYGGVQLGYEWAPLFECGSCSGWTLAPAMEFEAYFFSHTKEGHLISGTTLLPEHNFDNTFPMHVSVLLANAVVSLDSSCMCGFSPYVGVGLGATRFAIHHADSLQVDPQEPGVNHFNTRRSDASWAFAAQVKIGLKYQLCGSFQIFGEYRYLFVDNSNYVLGSTRYPDHVQTSPWNIRAKNFHYNAFAIGVRYSM